MTPYPLSSSETTTKILITLFMGTMIAAFTVAELNVYDKVGRIKQGVIQRYGPDKTDINSASSRAESATPGEADDNKSNPKSDSTAGASDEVLRMGAENPSSPLPEEGDMPVARINTFAALLDVTHPHIFEIPVVMLVLAHFLMRTRVAGWFKLANYIVGFGGIALFITAPWVVRYVSPGASPMLFVGAIAMGLGALITISVSVWDMWTPVRKPAPKRPAG